MESYALYSCIKLPPLSRILRFSQAVCVSSLLSFRDTIPLCRSVTISTFSCWQASGLFRILAFINKAVMNILVQIFLWTYVLISLGYTPKSKAAGSQGECGFYFIRNCQTVVWSGGNVSHGHHQCRRASCFRSLPALGFQLFYILILLRGSVCV